jgi:hypothetical protein
MPPIYDVTRFHPEDKTTGEMSLVTHLHLASVSKTACSYNSANHIFWYRVHGNFTLSSSLFIYQRLTNTFKFLRFLAYVYAIFREFLTIFCDTSK